MSRCAGLLKTRYWVDLCGELLTPEGIEHVRQVNAKRLADESKGLKTGTIRYELEQLCKNGGFIWTEVSVNPQRSDTGEIIGYQGVSRDVSKRKRAQEALAHSRDLMRYIIEHNRSAVAVHNRDLRYVYVSQKYLEEYGISDQDVVGKHHYEVFPDLPQK